MRRILSVGGPLALVGLFVALPRLSVSIPGVFGGPLNSPGTLQLLAVCCVYAGVAQTYDLLFGYTGLMSFGYALYFGTGVYAFGIAVTRWHWSFAVSVLFAAGIGILLSIIIGSVTLRVSGLAFAIVAFSVAQVFSLSVARNPGNLTGGSDGFSLDASRLPGIFVGIFNTKYLYWLALGYAILVFVIVRWVVGSSPGRIWQAIRENELRMQILSVHTYTYKMIAFVIASSLAAIGGVVYVLVQSAPDPSSTTSDFTLSLLIMVVLGGAGTKWGAVIGAVLYTYLDNRLTAVASSQSVQGLPHALRVPISEPKVWLGALFIATVLLLPGGISSIGPIVRRRIRELTARTSGAVEEAGAG